MQAAKFTLLGNLNRGRDSEGKWGEVRGMGKKRQSNGRLKGGRYTGKAETVQEGNGWRGGEGKEMW